MEAICRAWMGLANPSTLLGPHSPGPTSHYHSTIFLGIEFIIRTRPESIDIFQKFVEKIAFIQRAANSIYGGFRISMILGQRPRERRAGAICHLDKAR
jgi:hypothetical protein